MSRVKSMSRSPAEICADCTAFDPTWASINRGVLICDECCSVHRSLGRHISQVRSLKKGHWSPTLYSAVQQLANSGANNIWEHALLDPTHGRPIKRKPTPRDPVHPNKSDFIRKKYHFLAFVNKHNKDLEHNSVEDLSMQLHSSVRTGNLETCMRLLSKGADPNYFHPEKRNCPIHVAAQAGQALQVELLVVYGADPGVVDNSHKTPADYARAEGYLDLALRLIECQYELTDRLAYFLCNKTPDHRGGQHFIIPEMADSHLDLSELAKQAKKKLQALPNHLFEELAKDVYDEVDRRENDAHWNACHDQSILTERQMVAFLPVNPEFSTTRNQGRQKLARLNAREFATLIIDILIDAKRRQLGVVSPVHTPKVLKADTAMSVGDLRRPPRSTSPLEDDPIYDTVPDDDDNSSIDTQSIKSLRDDMKKDRPSDSMELIEYPEEPVPPEQYVTLQKKLMRSESQVRELREEILLLQNMVQQLQSENQSLREDKCSSHGSTGSSDPSNTPGSIPNGHQGEIVTPETNRLSSPAQRLDRSRARPQSMVEPRNQHKQSPWQVGQCNDKKVVSAVSEVNIRNVADRSGATSFRQNPVGHPPELNTHLEEGEERRSLVRGGSTGDVRAIGIAPRAEGGQDPNLPSQDDMKMKTEKISRKIRELMQLAQEGRHDSFGPCADHILEAVTDTVQLFPKVRMPSEITVAIESLTANAKLLQTECLDFHSSNAFSELELQNKTKYVIQHAYDVAKAARELVAILN
ncbi:ARF GTPase-activating protein GIT2-like [Liolophura sinensis]|uniref:ARF GTPase-activating protein GIT2-like n=1 Tax=Liolophura sinensis TaxID=3198878 RepID=UPI0031584082